MLLGEGSQEHRLGSKKQLSPGWCGSRLVGTSSRKPKDCGFDPQSERVREATNQDLFWVLFFFSLSPHSFLSGNNG